MNRNQPGRSRVMWQWVMLVVSCAMVLAAYPSDSAWAAEEAAAAPAAKDSGAAEATITKLYSIKNAAAPEVAEVLEKTFGDQMRFVAFPFGNAIIASGSPAACGRAEELIRSLDVPLAPQRDIKVFKLNYADPETCAKILSEVLREKINCVPDQRAKALILAGPAEGMAEAEQLIKVLDGEPAASPQEVRVYHLRYARADDGLRNALGLALRGTGPEAFSLDKERNAVIVRGDEGIHKLVEKVLAELDRPSAGPAVQSVRIRIVWLVSGLADSVATPEVPGDLAPAIEELKKMGMSGLRLGAQTLVHNTIDGRFSTYCTPMLGDPCRLTIEGSLGKGSGDRPSVELSLTAERDRSPGGPPAAQPPAPPRPPGAPLPPGGNTLCRVSSRVLATPGKPVVLAVAPTGEMTSVFLLQVLPGE